jgi:hypothetical protein
VQAAFRAATSHAYLSGYALNFCWVITHWVRAVRPEAFGGLTNGQADLIMTKDAAYTLLPKVLFFASYVGACLIAFVRPKTFENLLRFGLLGYLAYFTFNTGVHENHLFLAVILALLLYWQEQMSAATTLSVTLLSNANLFLFYGLDGTGYPHSRLVLGVDLALVLSIGATALFLALFVKSLISQELHREDIKA